MLKDKWIKQFMKDYHHIFLEEQDKKVVLLKECIYNNDWEPEGISKSKVIELIDEIFNKKVKR